MEKQTIERNITAHKPTLIPDRMAPRRSAVAIIIRFVSQKPEVLLMKRAVQAHDKWSGQISFPGGGAEKIDNNLLQTAIRETVEEVGIDLNQTARYIGQSDDIQAQAKGAFIPMAISPFVFFLTQSTELLLGEEADSAFWFPLESVLTHKYTSTLEYPFSETILKLPCWNYKGYTIWGLTYRMICVFIDIVLGSEGSLAKILYDSSK